ncbi:DUF1523 family protein [Campylobacter sp. RM16187]|uniref:DUF1523 family protein n=1 Tax=Campylobacter sp. RM16187 TaxID=1660063 RepID=UPI0021B5FE28|nr:DUF1523 family protein [Campylobacter sp. RM16187]QKG28449.1 hypothetical membrane protein (DUF1523 domain) [Campylobacter sp. RM16187]
MSFQEILRKSTKKLLITIALIAHLILAIIVNYSFPHYETALITGGEVKRVDKDGLISGENPADGPTRDVYFIYTQEINGTKVMTYRNEDTGFGFPFYLKFNSADLQAMAQSFAISQKKVQIKYYGWRITVLDKFRNAVSIKELKNSETGSNPIMSYIFYALIFASFLFFVFFTRKIFDKGIKA